MRGRSGARDGRRCASDGCPCRAAPSSGGRRRRACCRRIRRRGRGGPDARTSRRVPDGHRGRSRPSVRARSSRAGRASRAGRESREYPPSRAGRASRSGARSPRGRSAGRPRSLRSSELQRGFLAAPVGGVASPGRWPRCLTLLLPGLRAPGSADGGAERARGRALAVLRHGYCVLSGVRDRVHRARVLDERRAAMRTRAMLTGTVFLWCRIAPARILAQGMPWRSGPIDIQ